MKREHSKKTEKLIMSIIAIIMLCNFIMPNISIAASTEQGGSALSSTSEFLCWIPDIVTNLLQHTFISLDDIEIRDYTVSPVVNEYKILYSPGTIFAGTIPAFDINFINPGDDKESTGITSNMYSYVFYEAYCDDVTGDADMFNWTNKNGATFRIVIRANGRNSTQFDDDQTFSLVAYDESGEQMIWNEYKYVPDILKDQGGKTTQFVKNLIVASDSTIQDEAIDIAWNELGIGSWNFCEDGQIYFQGDISKETVSTEINGKAYELSRWAGYDANDVNYAVISSKYDGIEKEILRINNVYDEFLTHYDNDNIREKIVEDIAEKLMTAADISISQEELDQTTNDFINQLRNKIETDYPDALGETETRTYNNSARILQPIVAGWYKALRRIALVGLLSVLVYVGIRMTMSSTSPQDKAKYKKMFKDWFVALCLLFMLHYLMNITITVVTQINSIIGKSVIGPDGEDELLTSIRNRILHGASWSTVLSEVVIYAVITVYTVIFTIQYIRRTIYLAFLTTIAPLITLTYPLDKIKDSKSQAFDMWIKDYVFFTLLQVVHLLLYYIFVQTSVELAEWGNWIYAIVAIGFLTTAEKFMKKMFGFEKSKSMGTLAAGATGALVMNALNKISHNPPKNGNNKNLGNSTGKGSSRNVRTVTTNPLAGLMVLTGQNGGNTSITQTLNTSNESNSGDSQPSNNGVTENEIQSQGTNIPQRNLRNNATNITSENNNQEVITGNTQPDTRGRRSNNIQSQNSEPVNTMSPISIYDLAQLLNNRRDNNSNDDTLEENDRPKRNILGGIRAVAGRYLRPTVGKATGIMLGAAGTIIGFAGGTAQGDIGKALAGASGGAIAGYYGGQKITNATFNAAHTVTHLKESFERVADTWREGTLGTEEAGNIRFDREFRRSEGYKRLKRNNSNFSDEKIQKMLDAGITDPKKMDKILKKNAKHPRKYSIEKAIGYTELADKCPGNILYNNKKFIRYFQDRDINITPEEIESMRKIIIEFK